MPTIPEQIQQLAALLDKGLITRQQFDAQRDELMAGYTGGAPTPTMGDPRPAGAVGADLTGERIMEYRLERKLGEGGMGQVYLGSHETLDQKVAVKVLDPVLSRNEEVRTRFIQEANIQVSLQHPGIVRVLTANTDGEHLALVMEFVEGESLEQALVRLGRLPTRDALKLAEQVLAAVGHAHAKGVVHRDLKPSNIMVQAGGAAKVMDFGIAKVLGGAKLTRTGTLMGTAHYMSPEQVLGRTDIGPATDIYSLGVTLFEALTGQVPFQGAETDGTDSDFLVKQAHMNTAPPDPRILVPELPGSVCAALLRALAKDPAQRFESCEAVLAALIAPPSASTTAPVATPAARATVVESPAEPPPVPEASPPPVSRRDSPILPAVLGALIGGGVVLVLVLVVALVGGLIDLEGGDSSSGSERDTAASREEADERDERARADDRVPEGSIAVVNGMALGTEDLDQVARRMRPRAGTVDDEFKREVLDEVVDQTLLYDEGLRQGIDEDPKIRKMVVNTLLKRDVYGTVDPSEITEDELRAYFDAHREDFVVPEKVQIKRILIKVTDTVSSAEARAKAEDLRDDVARNPRSFKSLAQEHSQGPYARRGGDLGFVGMKGKPGVPQEIIEAAFALDKGDVSDVIETDDGFSVLYVPNRRDRVERTFDQMRGSVLRKVKSDRYNELYEVYVDRLSRDAVVGIDEEALQAYSPIPASDEEVATPGAGDPGEAEDDLLRLTPPG